MDFLGGITFESWIAITQSVPFILLMIVVWLAPIVLYIIIASAVHARTSSGKKLRTLMIQSPNAWIPIMIWFFFQSVLILLIMFPFWINWV